MKGRLVLHTIKNYTFRIKLLLILSGAIISGYFSYWAIETAASTIEKESHLSNGLSIQVNSVADVVELSIDKIVNFFELLPDSNSDANSEVIRKYSTQLNIKQWIALSVKKDGKMNPIGSSAGENSEDDDQSLLEQIEELGWDADRFKGESLLIGATANEELIIGNYIQKKGDAGTAYVSIVSFNMESLKLFPEEKILVVNPEGELVFTTETNESIESKKPATIKKIKSDIQKLIKIAPSDLDFHIKKWSSSDEFYFTGFRRLTYRDLTVVGMIPERLVFEKSANVRLKSIIITLGLILIASGLILLMTRRLEMNLRSMTSIVEKFSEGYFSVRIEQKEVEGDDLGPLLAAFNKMADRLDKMMLESVNKVESQYQSLVMNFVKNYTSDQIAVKSDFHFFCQTFLSSPYSGDWWYAIQIRDYLVTIIGKVDGKGVQAAIVASVARSAVVSYLANIEKDILKSPHLAEMIEQLNSCIFEVTKGEHFVSCFALITDTTTGQADLFNNTLISPSHFHQKSVKQIGIQINDLLGSKRTIDPQIITIRLQREDLIFWYTPGLKSPHSEPFKSKSLETDSIFRMIKRAYDQGMNNARLIGEIVTQDLTKNYEEALNKLSDDVTFSILTVPTGVKLEERGDIE